MEGGETEEQPESDETGRRKVSMKSQRGEEERQTERLKSSERGSGRENRRDGKVVVTAPRLLLTIPHLYI